MIRALALLAVAVGLAGSSSETRLAVPVIPQARERCGPAALAMVLSFYGADSAALRETDRAYDPVLRGALITELAACARRLGYEARVAEPGPDSLRRLVAEGVPPILLVGSGQGPLVRGHYVVLTAWDIRASRVTLLDGGPTPRSSSVASFLRAWRRQGGQALLVSVPRR